MTTSYRPDRHNQVANMQAMARWCCRTHAELIKSMLDIDIVSSDCSPQQCEGSSSPVLFDRICHVHQAHRACRGNACLDLDGGCIVNTVQPDCIINTVQPPGQPPSWRWRHIRDPCAGFEGSDTFLCDACGARCSGPARAEALEKTIRLGTAWHLTKACRARFGVPCSFHHAVGCAGHSCFTAD